MTDNSEPEFTFHDTAAINRYCETDYRPPKRPWLGVHDGKKQEQANPGVTVLKIVKVAFPTGAFRWATLRSRYRYAAWHWIAPSMEFTPDKLDLLKNISGLGSVDTAEFVSQLSFYCRRAANDHRRLDIWIKIRIALLEFATFRDSGPSRDILSAFTSGAFGLAGQAYRQSRSDSETPPRDELAAVLKIIVAEAQNVLSRSGKKCSASANLMLPMPLDESTRNGTWPFAHNRENAEKASMLWGDEADRAKRCLLIVPETENDEHVGFWVPLISTTKSTLPGACLAYRGGHGVAIFKRQLRRKEERSSADD